MKQVVLQTSTVLPANQKPYLKIPFSKGRVFNTPRMYQVLGDGVVGGMVGGRVGVVFDKYCVSTIT